LHKLLANKYYIDEIYNAVLVQPIRGISYYLFWKIMDVAIIDGLVNLTAFAIRGIGGSIRRLQTGVVQAYVVSMVIGIIIFLGYYLFVR
jgi:NADH-quinone oxidoreductase subunit L